MENLDDSLDKKECSMCHKILHKNYFRKLFGSNNHSSVCKKCEDKILTAKCIKIILKYLEPGEKFNKDNFIEKHQGDNLNEVIFTLQEHDIIKKDYGSNYYLESEDVLNNLLNIFLNESFKPTINFNDSTLKKDNVKKDFNESTINHEENHEIPGRIQCNICHKFLSKNNFMKLIKSDEYSKICKNCADKVLAANYLKIILKYLIPEVKFNKDEFINKHPDKDFNEIIFTLQEYNLIKKDFESNYYLESTEVLDEFKEKYLKEPPKLNKNLNYAVNNIKKIDTAIKENSKPFSHVTDDYNGFKGVSYNTDTHKWNPFIYNPNGNICLGDFDSERDAYQARFNYLQNIPENVKIPEKKSNGKYSSYEYVHFTKSICRWSSSVKVTNPYNPNQKQNLDLGLFGSEEEAYQARLGYLTENHELFNDPIKNSNGKFTNYAGVNYSYAYHQWYFHIIKEETKHWDIIGYFESEEEAYNARMDYLKRKGYVFPEKKTNGKYSYYEGISYNKGNYKWTARVKDFGENIYLGTFDSEMDAYNARQSYLEKHTQKISNDNIINTYLESNNKDIHVQRNNKSLNNLNVSNENDEVKFFVNTLNKNEIIVKGILSAHDAFNSLKNLKIIKSEINKIILDNIDEKIELFIEIKPNHSNLTNIVFLFKKIGWKQLKLN